jgi:hypothetical protein
MVLTAPVEDVNHSAEGYRWYLYVPSLELRVSPRLHVQGLGFVLALGERSRTSRASLLRLQRVSTQRRSRLTSRFSHFSHSSDELTPRTSYVVGSFSRPPAFQSLPNKTDKRQTTGRRWETVQFPILHPRPDSKSRQAVGRAGKLYHGALLVGSIEAVTYRINLSKGSRGSVRTRSVDLSSFYENILPAQKDSYMSIAGSGPRRYCVLPQRPRGISGLFPAPNSGLIPLLIKLGSLSRPVPSDAKIPRDIT